jgi:hypothetical protein
MKLSHTKLIIISGLIWFAVGCSLLPFGLSLLSEASRQEFNHAAYLPFIRALAPYAGGFEQGMLAIVIGALMIGYFKGRFVLGKSAVRGMERIRSMPNPASLAAIYSPKYYALLGGMVLLGMSIKWLGLPNDIRGFVDVAIGSALINGAMIYFRSLMMMPRTSE